MHESKNSWSLMAWLSVRRCATYPFQGSDRPHRPGGHDLPNVYTEKGPVGLAGGKRLVIASSRGGVYLANETLQALDHQETYLRSVLYFLGITDVSIVRAEGLRLSEETPAKTVTPAQAEIDRLAPRCRARNHKLSNAGATHEL